MKNKALKNSLLLFVKKHENGIKNIVIFFVTLIAMLAFFHFVRFPRVQGSSMSPTYVNGDTLVTLYTKNVDRDDVVVIWSSFLQEYIVKRVIGVSGDHIVIKDGVVYRNDQVLDEPYVREQDWIYTMDGEDIVVPQAQLYVLGDNRDDSTDSRILGLLSVDNVFGRVLWKL